MGDWERTEYPHVWYNSYDNIYTWEDETNGFNGHFLTAEEAKEELDKYIQWLMGEQ